MHIIGTKWEKKKFLTAHENIKSFIKLLKIGKVYAFKFLVKGALTLRWVVKCLSILIMSDTKEINILIN